MITGCYFFRCFAFFSVRRIKTLPSHNWWHTNKNNKRQSEREKTAVVERARVSECLIRFGTAVYNISCSLELLKFQQVGEHRIISIIGHRIKLFENYILRYIPFVWLSCFFRRCAPHSWANRFLSGHLRLLFFFSSSFFGTA